MLQGRGACRLRKPIQQHDITMQQALGGSQALLGPRKLSTRARSTRPLAVRVAAQQQRDADVSGPHALGALLGALAATSLVSGLQTCSSEAMWHPAGLRNAQGSNCRRRSGCPAPWAPPGGSRRRRRRLRQPALLVTPRSQPSARSRPCCDAGAEPRARVRRGSQARPGHRHAAAGRRAAAAAGGARCKAA